MKNILGKSLSIILTLMAVMSLSAIPASAVSVGKVESLQAYNIDDDEINLKWKKVSAADGYAVYMYTSKGWKNQGTTKKTKFEADDLTSAKQYKFKVRAYRLKNGKKVFGDYSSVLVSATAPDEIENVQVTKKSKTSVTLSWSKEKRATKYQVYMYDTAKEKYVRKITVSDTKATVKNLKAGTSYKFKVRAYFKSEDKKYYGAFSDICSVKTKGNSSGSSSSSPIGTAKAGSIALNHANLKESQVREFSCKPDIENGIQVYEVEFSYGRYEYEYEINALSGEIIFAEKSRD